MFCAYACARALGVCLSHFSALTKSSFVSVSRIVQQMLAYFHERLVGPACSSFAEDADEDADADGEALPCSSSSRGASAPAATSVVNVVFRTAAQDNWTCSFETDDPTLEMVRNIAKEVRHVTSDVSIELFELDLVFKENEGSWCNTIVHTLDVFAQGGWVIERKIESDTAEESSEVEAVARWLFSSTDVDLLGTFCALDN